MPQELFYDNACHLSEYCLNREPALFEDTRFWHDLFHATALLCGINFKSTRVEGFGRINTEICEQVNSYCQAIKYTGTHLSQDHFVFFLQFFLYLLNNDKTQRQSELASLAIAGMDQCVDMSSRRHRKGHIGVKTCKCTTIYVIQILFYSVLIPI